MEKAQKTTRDLDVKEERSQWWQKQPTWPHLLNSVAAGTGRPTLRIRSTQKKAEKDSIVEQHEVEPTHTCSYKSIPKCYTQKMHDGDTMLFHTTRKAEGGLMQGPWWAWKDKAQENLPTISHKKNARYQATNQWSSMHPLARSQWTLMNRDDDFGPRIQTSAAGMNQEPKCASDWGKTCLGQWICRTSSQHTDDDQDKERVERFPQKVLERMTPATWNRLAWCRPNSGSPWFCLVLHKRLWKRLS